MPNVQFEQEQYQPLYSPTEASRPWFIRLIFSLGLAENDNQANIISLIFITAIITAALVLFLRIDWQPEIPQELKNIQNYRQDLYRNL